MKQINFLGIPVNVIDDGEIDRQLATPEPKIVLVSRVADTDLTLGSPEYLARRTRTLCEGCGELCFLDPAGYAEIAILHPTLLCPQCMWSRLKAARDDSASE